MVKKIISKLPTIKLILLKFNKQRLLKSYIDRDKYLRPVANCYWWPYCKKRQWYSQLNSVCDWLIPMEPVGVMTTFQIPRAVIHLCYITGNYFPTVRTLTDYFEVTWHLSMKLLPSNISEKATVQYLKFVCCQRVRVHCYPGMLTEDRRYSMV